MPRTLLAILAALLVVAAPAAAHGINPSPLQLPKQPKATGPFATLAKGSKVYRGMGARGLGTLRLRHAAKLTWRHPRGSHIQVTTNGFTVMSSGARRGSLKLRAGSYPNLRIATSGGWRVTLTVLKGR